MGVVHHLNPYATVPLLEPHLDPAFPSATGTGWSPRTAPLFTLFTYALAPLGVPGGFWVLKLALCLSSLGVLTLMWHSASAARPRPRCARSRSSA
jgi:hypothetical protein